MYPYNFTLEIRNLKQLYLKYRRDLCLRTFNVIHFIYYICTSSAPLIMCYRIIHY